MNNPLVQLDPGLAIWTILVFLGLLFALKALAWNPLLTAVFIGMAIHAHH